MGASCWGGGWWTAMIRSITARSRETLTPYGEVEVVERVQQGRGHSPEDGNNSAASAVVQSRTLQTSQVRSSP